jgi:hypothetical protein
MSDNISTGRRKERTFTFEHNHHVHQQLYHNLEAKKHNTIIIINSCTGMYKLSSITYDVPGGLTNDPVKLLMII